MPTMRRARAMSLLEVLMAVTIVTIIGAAIVSTMAATSSSLRRGVSEATNLANARFAMEAMARDLMNIHYRDETSYNVNMRALLEEFERQRLEAEANRSWGDFERRYGPRDRRRGAGTDDAEYVGNPFDKGVLIDLSFQGTERTLTFARRRPTLQGSRDFQYGLSRVTWELKGDALVRTEDTVADPPRDWQGQVLEPETKPNTEVVAEGVTNLEFRYAFWYDSQWYESNTWNSSNRTTRNPKAFRSQEGQAFSSFVIQGLQPGDERYTDALNSLQSEPLDRTPSYVRIRLSVADPKRPGAVRHFARIVRIPGALETFTLDPDTPRNVAEAERRERERAYTPIFPGVLEDR